MRAAARAAGRAGTRVRGVPVNTAGCARTCSSTPSATATAPPPPPTNNNATHADLLRNVHVVAEEYGHSGRALPTWACKGPGTVDLDAWATHDPADGDAASSSGTADQRVAARLVDGVPGCFQLLNVLSRRECDAFIATTEAMGYDPDAPVSLPYSVRHMHNVNWLVDPSVDGEIWRRCAPAMPVHAVEVVPGAPAMGINARFRCYRYCEGDYFRPHTDGSWPGSRAMDGKLIRDAYPGELWSQYTFLIVLSDDYDGGCTEFLVGGGRDEQQKIAVRTPAGGVLCFPHGGHPDHSLHTGGIVTRGRKYMIRTEILYKRTPEADRLQGHWIA